MKMVNVVIYVRTVFHGFRLSYLALMDCCCYCLMRPQWQFANHRANTKYRLKLNRFDFPIFSTASERNNFQKFDLFGITCVNEEISAFSLFVHLLRVQRHMNDGCLSCWCFVFKVSACAAYLLIGYSTVYTLVQYQWSKKYMALDRTSYTAWMPSWSKRTLWNSGKCANSCLFNWVINLNVHRMATVVTLASEAMWILEASRVFIACIGINISFYISYRSMDYQWICILSFFSQNKK